MEDILQRAGPRSRELCKALLCLYGPLLSLTPRNVATIQDLLSALTRQGRHKQLKALDLSHVADLVTDTSLEPICRALPHLQQLHLRLTCQLTAPAFAALKLQPASSPLTALQLSSLLPYTATSAVLRESRIMGSIVELCQLRELALPTFAAMLLAAEDEQLAKLVACTQLTQLSFADTECDPEDFEVIDADCIMRCAEQLPALVSLKMDAQYMYIEAPLARLQALTALTELHLGTAMSSSELLHAIGAMTGLQSLQLSILYSSWDPAESGWLTRLSLLTCSSVSYMAVDGDPRTFAEVLSAVPHLPVLRCFQVASDLPQLVHWQSDEAFAGLGSASGVLEQLHLGCLELPRSCMEVIQQLTGLTALGIRGCSVGAIRGSFWMGASALTALTGLRVLDARDLAGDCTVAPAAIERLKQLHTLLLNGDLLNKPYLTRLCAALPQLRVLGIGGSGNIGSG